MEFFERIPCIVKIKRTEVIQISLSHESVLVNARALKGEIPVDTLLTSQLIQIQWNTCIIGDYLDPTQYLYTNESFTIHLTFLIRTSVRLDRWHCMCLETIPGNTSDSV